LKQGRFTRAIRAQQRNKLTRSHRKADAIHSLSSAKVFAELVDDQWIGKKICHGG